MSFLANSLLALSLEFNNNIYNIMNRNTSSTNNNNNKSVDGMDVPNAVFAYGWYGGACNRMYVSELYHDLSP